MRSWRRFRMVLHAKGAQLVMAQARDRIVIQIKMRNFAAIQAGVRRDRKSVIVRRDLHFAASEMLDRLIAASVAKAHFFRLATKRQRKYLMTEANTKYRRHTQ